MNPRIIAVSLCSLALIAGCKSGTAPEASTTISVVITPARASLLPGQQRQMSAKVLGPPGIPQGVIWRSQDPAVATINNDGLVNAIGEGGTTIRAFWAADTLEYGIADVQVTSTPVVDGQPALRSVLIPRK